MTDCARCHKPLSEPEVKFALLLDLEQHHIACAGSSAIRDGFDRLADGHAKDAKRFERDGDDEAAGLSRGFEDEMRLSAAAIRAQEDQARAARRDAGR